MAAVFVCECVSATINAVMSLTGCWLISVCVCVQSFRVLLFDDLSTVWTNWRLLLQDNCWYESETYCGSLLNSWVISWQEILPQMLCSARQSSLICDVHHVGGVIFGLDVIYSKGKPSFPLWLHHTPPLQSLPVAQFQTIHNRNLNQIQFWSGLMDFSPPEPEGGCFGG